MQDAFRPLVAGYEQAVDRELRRFWGWGYAEFLTHLIDLAEPPPEAGVLDLATGTGLLPRLLRQRGHGGRVVGLDITIEMLQAARGQAEGARWVCASAMALPFASGSMDVVFCALGTHHMDPDRLAEEASRILSPGGALVLADVAMPPTWRAPVIRGVLRVLAWAYFWRRDGLARAWAEADAVHHVRTLAEWHRVLDAVGLAEVRVAQPGSQRWWSPVPFMIVAHKRAQPDMEAMDGHRN